MKIHKPQKKQKKQKNTKEEEERQKQCFSGALLNKKDPMLRGLRDINQEFISILLLKELLLLFRHLLPLVQL
jgi:hypothetical protein